MMTNNTKNGQPWRRLILVAAGLLMMISVGCEDPVEEPEDVEPYVIDDPYDLVPFQDGVDRSMGHPDIDDGVPGDDEARVGRIQAEETGFEGAVSHCRSGDFRMSNAKIEVCIQEESTNRYERYTGGVLVDAHRHDQQGGEDVLDFVMPLLFNLHTATAESVEVVRDGSDGGVAVLRVTGQDIDLAHLTGVTGRRFHTPLGIKVETEYRLAPGSTDVEMMTMLSPPTSNEMTHIVGDWFAYGDRARAWAPEIGFDNGSGEFGWIAGFGHDRSFGLVFEDTASPLGAAEAFELPWSEMRVDNVTMSSEAPGVIRRWFVVGDGTVDSVRRRAADLRDEELAGEPVSISVVDDAQQPVEGAEVAVRRGDDDWITIGISDADGDVELILEPGSYEAEVSGFAGPLEFVDSFVVGDGDIDLVVPEIAYVDFDIREAGTDEAISTRVTFDHEELGRWYEYSLHGTLQTVVPAGEVTVMVTRGIEYDLFREVMEFSPGAEHSREVELVRGLNTDGWRSGDFHQHMEPSLDSRMYLGDRVKENATQGVELMVPTDHDVVTDLGPEIEKLGLGDVLSTFPGVEISPLYSHYNLYPVPYRPEKRGRGTVELSRMVDGAVQKRRMPAVIEVARSFETDPVVQMNHPRNNSGMMNHVSFDPELGLAEGVSETTGHDFAIDIDAIEVINRYGDICQVVADWSGLLNEGKRITGLGNSDSHRINAEAGVPRNYMVMDVGPGEITADLAREALRNQRVSVASQAFIDFADGTLPGDEIQVEDRTATFELRVQTPDWAQAQSLFVIVNGEVVESIARSAEDGARFDFEETIEVEIDEDSWVVFWSDGPRPNVPLESTRQTIAFTNPVFLKTGDGSWEAPGPGPLDLDAIDTGYCS